MSVSRALPAAPPHPELAALLLAFADPPVGEGDAALGAPRLVLADWLAERADWREAHVRAGVKGQDVAAGIAAVQRAVAIAGQAASRLGTAAALRACRRRLLALFPEVVLRKTCSFCGGSGQALEVSAVRNVGGRLEYDDPRPAQCMACGGSGWEEEVAASLLVPEEPPA